MAKVYPKSLENIWKEPHFPNQDLGWKTEGHTQSGIQFRIIAAWWKIRQWINTCDGAVVWWANRSESGEGRGVFVPHAQLGHVGPVLESLLGLEWPGLYGSSPQTIEKQWRPESGPISYSSNSQSSWSRESHLGNVAEEKSWEGPGPPRVTPFLSWIVFLFSIFKVLKPCLKNLVPSLIFHREKLRVPTALLSS